MVAITILGYSEKALKSKRRYWAFIGYIFTSIGRKHFIVAFYSRRLVFDTKTATLFYCFPWNEL